VDRVLFFNRATSCVFQMNCIYRNKPNGASSSDGDNNNDKNTVYMISYVADTNKYSTYLLCAQKI
jgi:hypothetical protein